MAKRHDQQVLPTTTAVDESRTPKRLMTSLAPSEKVCLICRHLFGTAEYIYSIYVLDIELEYTKEGNDVFNELEPVIRMRSCCLRDMAFVGWRGKLYLFGGMYLGEKGKINWEKDMYILDISNITSTTTTMEIDSEHLSLMKGQHSMNTAKSHPFAAIVDDKICVFSRCISSMPLEYQNFEIFDPITQSWTELPELPKLRQNDFYRIESYCVQNSNLFISTKHGIYRIDVKQPTAWIFLDICLGVPKFPPHGNTSHGMAVVIDHVYFTPHFAYLGFAEPETPLTFLLKCCPPMPLSSLLGDLDDDDDDDDDDVEPVLARCNGCITCVGGNRICTMMAGFNEEVEGKSYPFLVVDVFNFSAKYDASNSQLRKHIQGLNPSVAVLEAAKLLETGFSAIKSSKYVLTGYRCEMVQLKCFPI